MSPKDWTVGLVVCRVVEELWFLFVGVGVYRDLQLGYV